MAELKIFGYADKISVKPGDTISFFVHADGTTLADAQLVRLIHGDAHPSGPGYIEEEIRSPINGAWTVRKQYTQVGSFLTVDDPQRRLALVFAKLKHFLRKAAARTVDAICLAIGNVVRLFSREECASYLVNAGYRRT